MVRAAVALVHLDRPRPSRDGEQLVAEADAENRQVEPEQFADHRHRIFTRRRRIAGAVGQEHAVRLMRHDILDAGGGGQHRHPRPGAHEVAEDIVLRPVIHRDDMGHLPFRSC